MAKNKKPRKPHQARPVNLPMMAATRDRLALQLHMAVEALILAPSAGTYNSLSTKLCTLANAGMPADALLPANTIVRDICDRYERVGKVGVSDAEAMGLRAVIGDIDRLLATVPANVLINAEVVTAVHCEEMGI